MSGFLFTVLYEQRFPPTVLPLSLRLVFSWCFLKHLCVLKPGAHSYLHIPDSSRVPPLCCSLGCTSSEVLPGVRLSSTDDRLVVYQMKLRERFSCGKNMLLVQFSVSSANAHVTLRKAHFTTFSYI